MSTDDLSVTPAFPVSEPWWDVYVPALLGEQEASILALHRLETETPPSRLGDVLAIGARAHAALGRPRDAARYADRAYSAGGPEADALATLLRPHGDATIDRRITTHSRAGARADAACDRVLLRVKDGDVPAARRAVEEAFSLCPDHVEATRWRRVLASDDPCVAVRRAVVDGRSARRDPASREAIELVPVRATGWLSSDRFHRRVLGGPGPAPLAPPTCALGRLQDVGATGGFFALDHEYRVLGPRDPLVALELCAEHLCIEVSVRHDPLATAETLWRRAAELDRVAVHDAAQLLVAQATHDRRLAPLGLEAAEVLLRAGGTEALWRGYRAWLRHSAGVEGALEDARDVVAAPQGDAAGWSLAVQTLRFAGRPEEAEAAIGRARREPALARAARELADRRDPPRMAVGGRIAPRGVQLAN